MRARHGILVVVWLAATGGTAAAQAFDHARYRTLAEECGDFYAAAQTAVSSSEPGMALVYLDLGADPCTSAWMMLSDDHLLAEGDWTAYAAEALSRDAQRAELLASLGECDEGRTLLGSTGWLVEHLPEAAVEPFARATHAVLRCGSGDGPGTAAVELGPIRAEWWMSGAVAGVEDANARFGPDCVGNVALAPDWTLDVLEPGDVSIAVVSDADTTLILSGPEGVHCNDDTDGFDPGLVLPLAAGRYAVYVGTYVTGAAGTAYSIQFRWGASGTFVTPPATPSGPPAMPSAPAPTGSPPP